MRNRDFSYRRRPSAKVFARSFIVVAALLSIALPAREADAISFAISYGTGFDTQAQKDALAYAANIWGGLLANSYPGETIGINASFDSSLSGTSIVASTQQIWMGESGGVVYPGALWNHLEGGDQVGSLAEFSMEFNPDIVELGIHIPWNYDPSGFTVTPAMDFVTNALHEIMHGLGMTSSLQPNGQYLVQTTGGNVYEPFIYDTFVTNASGVHLTDMSTSDLIAASISPMYFGGTNAIAANGTAPMLYSPDPFEPGVSVVHLGASFSTDLMEHNLSPGEFNHNPSALDLAILKDLGWDIAAIPEPASVSLLVLGLGILSLTSHLRRKK